VDYPSDADVSFTYDTLGRRSTMTDATGTTSWSYDSPGRLATNTLAGVDRSLVFGYDTYGQKTIMQFQNTQSGNSTGRSVACQWGQATTLHIFLVFFIFSKDCIL